MAVPVYHQGKELMITPDSPRPRGMRLYLLGIPGTILIITVLAIVAVSFLHSGSSSSAGQPSAGDHPGAHPGAVTVPTVRTYVHKVPAIPVLAWHQVIGGVATTPAEDELWNFNKDCKPTAAVCNAPNNPETVSLAQLSSELGWLKQQGYHSITAAQYYAWDEGKTVALPSKPVLLTVDDGTLNSYVNVTAVLRKYDDNMVAFIVSQFAAGATAGQQPYVGWDATWAQLKALPPAQWSFAFHAGAHGHNITFPGNKACEYYYPCQLPTETDAQYESRVSGEITAGRSAELAELGPRFDSDFWAVPWNDLGNSDDGLPTEGYASAWLPPWAASQFPVIFIQDPLHNGYLHERYRLEVQGTWSLATFRYYMLGNTQHGFFNVK
jgi:hypothetical protein